MCESCTILCIQLLLHENSKYYRNKAVVCFENNLFLLIKLTSLDVKNNEKYNNQSRLQIFSTVKILNILIHPLWVNSSTD